MFEVKYNEMQIAIDNLTVLSILVLKELLMIGLPMVMSLEKYI